MRKITFTLALSLALAAFVGCGGTTSSITNPAPEAAAVASTGIPQYVLDGIDAAAISTPQSTFEVVDAETGALVLRDVLTNDGTGTYEIGDRTAQGPNQEPLLHQAFRVTMLLDVNGPTGFTPRGYTSAGNPLYYIGDTVVYDGSIAARNPGRARIMSRLGAFDVEFRHLFSSDHEMIPECIPGQNPLTIQDVDYLAHTPHFGPYSWSPDGKTFTSTGMQFKICNLPGMEYGTDLVNARLYWVVPGSQFGLPCGTCEVRAVIFDRIIGIYDPPAP